MLNLFIFRRDYRIVDNTGLIDALKNYENVVPIFIGTPEQLVKNPYKANFGIQFLCESLCELSDELESNGSKLYCFFGDNVDILEKIMKKNEIESVNFNGDYTPYAVKRDKQIAGLCKDFGVECNVYHDYLLSPPGTILTQVNTPYKVYGPFRKKEEALKIDKPSTSKKTELKNLYSGTLKGVKVLKSTFLKDYYKENKNANTTGGRKKALIILKNISKFGNYQKYRDELTYETTELSGYIKFGCVSIREVYWAIKNKISDALSEQTLISQLIWRDFYYHLLFFYPEFLNNSMRKKFKEFKWIDNKKWFKAWCEGKTGYPVVDACMRQLNKTGYMHNRGRLITSNFLTKILICNWKWGEKYYAQNLIDYDPAVNNGNWQWSAGTGSDTAPYSQRIFNPWTQSSKFDPNCFYIKRWVPELNNVPNKDIHNWITACEIPKYKKLKYPKPIVDYKTQRDAVKRIYKLI